MLATFARRIQLIGGGTGGLTTAGAYIVPPTQRPNPSFLFPVLNATAYAPEQSFVAMPWAPVRKINLALKSAKIEYSRAVPKILPSSLSWPCPGLRCADDAFAGLSKSILEH